MSDEKGKRLAQILEASNPPEDEDDGLSSVGRPLAKMTPKERGDRLVALAAAMGDIEEPDFSLIGRPTGRILWSISHQKAEEFRSAAAAWHEATRFMSSLTDIEADPNYQHIIAMGADILPMIFRELAAEPDHWGAALTAITGADPIDPSIYGDIPAIAEAWLEWGRQNGYGFACKK